MGAAEGYVEEGFVPLLGVIVFWWRDHGFLRHHFFEVGWGGVEVRGVDFEDAAGCEFAEWSCGGERCYGAVDYGCERGGVWCDFVVGDFIVGGGPGPGRCPPD